MRVYLSERDDVESTDISIDYWYGYPIPSEGIGCTISIDDVTDGQITGSYTLSAFSYEADGLLQAHGDFVMPVPVCNITQAQAATSLAECAPWLD